MPALVFIDGNDLRAAEIRQIMTGLEPGLELRVEALQTGFSTSAPEPGQRARDKVLNWDCRCVIVAHGELPRTNGNAFLAKSFRWLARRSDSRQDSSAVD